MRILGLREFSEIGRYQDIFIILAWTSILTAILLNIFHRPPGIGQLSFDIHGTCTGAILCQSLSDLELILAAAVGAGILLNSERLVVAGFVLVHLLSTTLFVVTLTTPVLLGLVDYPVSETIVSLVLINAFALQFPVPLLLSLIGCLLGASFRTRIGISRPE